MKKILRWLKGEFAYAHSFAAARRALRRTQEGVPS